MLWAALSQEANDVFKKYGDCKDNSSILSEMLSIAGLRAASWRDRSIPYTYEEVPTPADNHMILSYENKGKTYYLDATGVTSHWIHHLLSKEKKR